LGSTYTNGCKNYVFLE
jgi:hypothetical protein